MINASEYLKQQAAGLQVRAQVITENLEDAQKELNEATRTRDELLQKANDFIAEANRIAKLEEASLGSTRTFGDQ